MSLTASDALIALHCSTKKERQEPTLRADCAVVTAVLMTGRVLQSAGAVGVIRVEKVLGVLSRGRHTPLDAIGLGRPP